MSATGTTTPGVRLPIEALMSSSKYKLQRDLFLQGFAAVQNKDVFNRNSLFERQEIDSGFTFKDVDPTSFFAVASIHGIPYEPYDFLDTDKLGPDNWIPGSSQYGGYCHHGDILFPTWHRPYVMLLEKLIYDEAAEIVKKYPEKLKADYSKALEELRFPYWDWGSPVTLEKGVPSVFWDETVEVEAPDGKTSITNPLRSYVLPRDLGTLQLVGNSASPTKKPYIPDSNTPYTPKGYATVRNPDTNYVSNQDSTSLAVVTSCNTTYRPSLYQLFNYVKSWRQFSNHGDKKYVAIVDGKEVKPLTESYGHYTSIEVIHDGVHGDVGGSGGHMANSDIAAFDPIFFLHHCNVDRLIAIWQAINPNAWLDEADLKGSGPLDKKVINEGTFTQKPGVPLTEDTPLAPFRKSETEFWTSKGVRDVVALGYTYCELKDHIDPSKDPKSCDRYKSEELKKYIVDLYRPNVHVQNHWQLTATVKKNAAGGPYLLRVFIDIDHADEHTSTHSPNFAGQISIFARSKDTQCANCKAHPDAVVHGSVDLTNCMQALNIDLNRNSLQANQIKFVAIGTNNKKRLIWEDLVIKADLCKYDESDVDHKKWSKTHVSSVYPPGN